MTSKAVIAVLLCVVATGVTASAQSDIGSRPFRDRNLTLTAIDDLKVGHFTLADRPTGCTVVLAGDGAIGSVDVRGAAPGTRETDVLSPVNDVRTVNAILLSGGSAFGLDAASGVMTWLDERRIGQSAGIDVVPIVPAAVLIDLWFGGDPRVRPGADCGYRAATAASNAPVEEGNVGAGAGATVGKLLGYGDGGRGGPMKAGIGSSAIVRSDGLVVAAMVAVNALGDIIDPETGRVLAGARGADGRLADARTLLRAGTVSARRPGGNTTLGVVATNARLTKLQAQKVAQMAHDGYARAISPIHTLADGDTIFSLATGTWNGQINEGVVGALAADAIAEAILRAAVQATASHGLPSARDLGTIPSRFKQ